MNPLSWLRRMRLRRLVTRHLENGADVWDAYESQAPLPPLRFRDGRSLEHGPRDAPVFLFFEIFANRCYARHLPKRSDGVIVDIGANIGAFTLECAGRYPEAAFHAYEPDPGARERLRRNVEANGLRDRVTIWPEAVSGAKGTLGFRAGGVTLEAGAYARAGELIQVPCVRLREVVERVGGPIAILKIDAEGAEADILEAHPLEAARAELIIGEFHEALVPGVAARVMTALSPAFDVTVCTSRRCGPMFVATRRAVA